MGLLEFIFGIIGGVIGLVFGLMRKRTKGVVVCMVSHATYNMVGTLLGML